jgi:hypothetical protein
MCCHRRKNVIWIDFADGFLCPFIPGNQPSVFGICRLVQRVVAGDDWVAGVVFRDLDPESDRLVLEDFEVPEQSLGTATIGVPILVLAARNAVQIQDHI